MTNVLRSKFLNKSIDDVMLKEMKQTMGETISSVFDKSSHKISNLAIEWLTSQYFKITKLTKEDSVSDVVIMNEVSVSELKTNELELLNDLFYETSFGTIISQELERRKRDDLC